jgi:isopenicillin-N epimerase
MSVPPTVDAGEPFGHPMRRHWVLDPAIHFLNHGSFGATPRVVLAEQARWRDRMEAEPVRFMTDELPVALRAQRERLARFVNAPVSRTAFVDNTTEGINTILRSLRWRRGERLVVANHAYPAVRNALRFLAEREGIEPVVAAVPWPLPDAGALVDAYLAALRGGARLAIIDHVFSPLAVVTPLDAILGFCASRGIDTLIDGAHAPALIDLDVSALLARGATWYVGNAHKWLCAPKGCAFLAAREGAERELHPVVISNYFGEGFEAEFGWTGTRDPSAKLAVGAAIDFIEAIGAPRYRAALHAQARQMAAAFGKAWGCSPGAPDALLAGMVSLPLPVAEHATPESARRWRAHFLRFCATEVPVFAIDGRHWVRLSAQVYNESADWEPLAAAFSKQTGD